MTLKVITTRRSRQTLTVTYNLINATFGVNIANDFLAKVDKTVGLIAKQPFMFKAISIDENVRVGFITKQCSLIYLIE